MFEKELMKEEVVEEVLGEETSNEELVSTRSGSLTIAIIGDSMVDTMETGLPYLAKILNPKYKKRFTHLTWEEIYEKVIKGTDGFEDLSWYLKNKSLKCHRAFNII